MKTKQSATLLNSEYISTLIRKRKATGHKGTFGHTFIVAGSADKIGAAILSSTAALKSGCGLLTAAVPASAVTPLMCRLPEAMVLVRDAALDLTTIDLVKYDAIGFGPGVGVTKESAELLFHILYQHQQPLVMDADGITLLAQNKSWFELLKPNIILTPHVGEFDRLTKKHTSHAARFETQLAFSKKHKVNILLKGHQTTITTADGKVFKNTTGNDGMATAGSGDVLTGIITSLCAQRYSPVEAACLGAYLHGYAGDVAAAKLSRTSMLASDIADGIAAFFKAFER
jgi:NAD(P)H-hydrate epimerase